MKTWNIGGVEMTSPLIIGGGVCKSPKSNIQYDHPDLPLGAQESGSYTPEARKGNESSPQEAWIDQIFSGLNSWGMPNDGFDAVCQQFSQMTFKRPVLVNVAGFATKDYGLALQKFCTESLWKIIVAIVFNLGCPNTHDKKTLPMSYDLVSLRELFELCRRVMSQLPEHLRKPVWVKLSPYLLQGDVDYLSRYVDVRSVPVVDATFCVEVAKLIAEYEGFVRAVVNCNTIPNCRYKGKNGKWLTAPNDGQAGLSGDLLWEIALRQNQTMRPILPQSIDLVHSGGINTGDRVVEALHYAQGAEVTSLVHWFGGPRATSRLVEESEALQNLLSS